MLRGGSREDGQAAVELCALLPLVAALALGLWQVAVWGQAAWSAGSAARAGARAHAVGADPLFAARRALPNALRTGLRVRPGADGQVEVTVAVPLVVGHGTLITVHDRARFAPQGP